MFNIFCISGNNYLIYFIKISSFYFGYFLNFIYNCLILKNINVFFLMFKIKKIIIFVENKFEINIIDILILNI